MTRRFLRVSFAALALFLTAASSVNLRHANAVSCDECATVSGPNVICEFVLPDGTVIKCFGE